jgi:threonine dehydrogenase-like Zn-dependent dehydrogenase
VPAQLLDTLNGDMPTAVFDATGNGASMMNAVSYVAHGGRLIFVGHIKGELTFSNPEIHKRELTLYCSRNATPDDFTQVINAVESKMIVPDSWITHRASFDSLVADFAGWLAPGSQLIKAILRASPEDLKA